MNRNELYKIINKKNGGEQMLSSLAKEVCGVLKKVDRMPNNECFPTEDFVSKSLDSTGAVTFTLFICSERRPKFLTTKTPEKFIPLEEPSNGLIFSRIPKLKTLVADLWSLGIPSKVEFLVGDNNFEAYIGLASPDVKMDANVYSDRRLFYRDSMKARLLRFLPQGIDVWSIGEVEDFGFGFPEATFQPPKDLLSEEMDLLRWVFSRFYVNIPMPDEVLLEKIATAKIRSYGELGELLEMTGGILLNTQGQESLSSWLRSIKGYMSSGASFPVVYPWIRCQN